MRLEGIEESAKRKAKEQGLASLSDEELLSLVLVGGVRGYGAKAIARNLLRFYGGLDRIGGHPWRSYLKMVGVSETKALSLAAVYEIGRRVSVPPLGERPSLDPGRLYLRYKALFGFETRERLLLLLLDKKGRLIVEKTLYMGTESGVRYSESEILKELLAGGCSSFVMAHNHPSGVAAPSKGETEATLHLASESAKLGIRLLDHLIVGENGYFSFKETGLLAN
jgi:DNA repair protein RadC